MIIRNSLAGLRLQRLPVPLQLRLERPAVRRQSLYNQRTARRDIFCYPGDVSWRDIEEYRRTRDYRR